MEASNSTLVSDIKKWWVKRSTLEQKLVVWLLFICLILTGTVLFIIIKHAVTPCVCTNSACIEAAFHVVSHVDPTADPCEDFFQFACGKFIQHSHGDINAADVKRLQEEVQRQIAEILTEPITDSENIWVRRQKQLFRSCMNEAAIKEGSLDVFRKIVKELGGWPVAIGYQWDERNFDWREMIYKLKEMGFSHHAYLLDVEITPDLHLDRKNRHITFVSSAYVPEVVNEKQYKAYMTDLAVILGADINRAEIGMQRTLEFMLNLKNIFPNSTDNFTADFLERRHKVGDYHKSKQEIDWLEFINNLLHPVAKIHKDDYVVFPRTSYTNDFFRLLYRTPKRTIANYIIWRFLEDFIPFMPDEFQQRRANYTCAVGKSSKQKTRFEFCKNLVTMGDSALQPTDVIYARKYLPKSKKKKVEKIYKKIKEEFISTLEEMPWLDKESRKKVVEQAENIKAFIGGCPDDYYSDSIFNRFIGDNYTDFKNASFLDMYVKHLKIIADSETLRLYMNVNDTVLERYDSYVTSVNAMFWLSQNTLVLPAAVLQGIIYDDDRPGYLNYGALGTLIGHELMHGFGGLIYEFQMEAEENVMWSNNTFEAYKKHAQCLVDEANEYQDESGLPMTGTDTLEENVADFVGLKVAYDVYIRWIMFENDVEPLLPALSYTPTQLFWISSVLCQCFQRKERATDDVHALSSFRATAPLRNNPHFAKDFKCPIGSKMNPAERCQVI